MRGLHDHEVVENALAMSIMDLRRFVRPIAADETTLSLLREDLKLLAQTVADIEASV